MLALARLQKWPLTLSAHKYQIVYLFGKETGHDDRLSWLPLPERSAATWGEHPPNGIMGINLIASSQCPSLPPPPPPPPKNRPENH